MSDEHDPTDAGDAPPSPPGGTSPAGTPPTELVLVERDGDVVHVRFARPDRHNALLPEMWQRFAAIGADLVADETVKAVVVSGEGASFSSGLDRRALASGALSPFTFTGREEDRGRTEFGDDDIVAAQAVGRWLHDGDFVSIAATRGFAFGAAAQITFACDVRVVGDDTTFRLPEIEIGLFPEMTATALLPGIVGYDRALEIGLTGRPVDAAEAERIGLATRVVAADRAVDEALELARHVGSLKHAAVRHCVRAMRLGARGRTDDAFREARLGGIQLLGDLVTEWDG